MVLDETLTVAAQQPCVLEAGSACQATFIAQYEREQHAYLMYVTGLREKRSSSAGAQLVDVAVDVRVAATDVEDGARALKALTMGDVGCGHRRLAAENPRVAELEAEVARLQDEVRGLRRQLALPAGGDGP